MHGNAAFEAGLSHSDVMETLRRLVLRSKFENPDSNDPGYLRRGRTAVFDGSIYPFIPTSDMGEIIGFEGVARCRVVGRTVDHSGVALVLKQVNPFNDKIAGVYIRSVVPETDGFDTQPDERGVRIDVGHALWPQRGMWDCPEALMIADTMRPTDFTEAQIVVDALKAQEAFSTSLRRA